ncbi:LOW QUALITY PROTEIN: proto-oncogene tyrosine-protein kinase Src-like [Ciona intestinalis]
MGIPFQNPPNPMPVYMSGQLQNMGGQVQIPVNQRPVYMLGPQQNIGGQVQIPVNQMPVYMPGQLQNGNMGIPFQNPPNQVPVYMSGQLQNMGCQVQNPPNQMPVYMPGQLQNMGIPFQNPPNQMPVYMPGQLQNMGGQVQIPPNQMPVYMSGQLPNGNMGIPFQNPPNQVPVYMSGQLQNMGGQVQIPVNQMPVYMSGQLQNMGCQVQNPPNQMPVYMSGQLQNGNMGIPFQNPPNQRPVYMSGQLQNGNMGIPFQNPPNQRPVYMSVTGALNYVAIWDFQASSSSCLSFRKRDILYILDTEGDWWQAQSALTGQKGCVPSNYVTLAGSLEHEYWFFGKKSRKECERMLVQHEPGTYMITQSETDTGSYRISFTVQEGLILVIQHDKFLAFDNSEVVQSAYEVQTHSSCHFKQWCPKNEKPETSGIAPDVWEIDQKHLELQKKLGAGYFGEVWKGGWVKVAIKTLKPGTMSSEAFLEEAEILRKLRHPKIVQKKKFYAVVTTEPIYIVTEFMCHGSLLDYLKGGAGKHSNLMNQIDMAAQIVEGMAFIERNNYIHRDLRADNILVGENRVCKVADCGLARLIKDDVYMSTGSKFPVKWTAPEAIYERRFTIKSDVWSFGILLTEILTKGKEPYPGMQNEEVKGEVKKGYRIPKTEVSSDCTDQLYALMRQCWYEDANQRPGFESIQETLEEIFYRTPLSRPLLADI